MRSFPSTLNESQNMYGSTKSQTYENKFDIGRLTGMNLNKSMIVVQEMLKESNINISNYQSYPKLTDVANVNFSINKNNKKNDNDSNETIFYENPLQLPADIIALAKDYDWVYKSKVKSIVNEEKHDKSMKITEANTDVVPSMFNPLYGVSLRGLTRNTPLLNDIKDSMLDPNINDCSIRTLCALSKHVNSPLGQARYRYADFMYCKYLGKVSNNHLITLRKFAHPIGDHITTLTTPKYLGGEFTFKTESDVGRLVTWFDVDGNRLEDICKYSYHATWRDMQSEIQQLESKADDPSTGILGMISNGFNPVYNKAVANGQAGEHSIWGWLGSKLGAPIYQGIGKNNELLRNYDTHKVYEPKNTIQSTHVYEGKLEFSQEFTINFSYQLRAYDNINPRSALLDLLGNILEVTYRRGKFWGGERKLIGPPQNMSTFDTVSKFVDNAFDKLGGYTQSLVNGTLKLGDIMGKLGSLICDAWNTAKGIATGGLSGELAEKAKNTLQSSGVAEAAKGYIKNALGRPTLYAWNSILSGDNVGLWHIMIGNPRNPILSIGNLILTNATVQHSGPLGIDDFPTELKVSITLKHARGRDITEIGHMYTNGVAALYHTLAHTNITDFYDDINYDDSKVQAADSVDKKQEYRDSSFANDVTKYQGDDIVINAANPFLENATERKIAKTNNWSDIMLFLSQQEVA